MTYLVMDNCVGCKHTDCVEVCPVDCFYEGANFLVINPDECIDCGLCEPECPIDAIKCDFDMTPEEVIKWTDINAKYAEQWPVITKVKAPLEDAADLDGIPNKFEQIFDPDPGTGND